ncbi:MAG: hypothetical protein IH840_10395 [Candidatus Heimdallarchaeota archaeon]|nr:hypothetical protein [Candidatus Heimdallarchaeota archaeon]
MVVNPIQHSNRGIDTIDKFRAEKLKDYFVADIEVSNRTYIIWENQDDQFKHINELLTEIRNLCKEGVKHVSANDKNMIFNKIIELAPNLRKDE